MEQNPAPNPLLIWWILWFSILSGLVILFFFLRGGSSAPAGGLAYLPLLPLSFGAFVRWVLLPKAKSAPQALPLFLIGLALSEACGILSFVLVPEMRNTYFILALLGVIQFVPVFASRFAK